MLTTKNRVKVFLSFFLLLATVMTGCTPQGPRALLKGKRHLERGDYSKAIEQLHVATSILRTNADAWNSLGLAYHHSGDISNAVQSYRHAIALDPNLGEARYNLGCLWLERDRPDLARDELMALTMHSGDTAEGWLKLGMAQTRSRDARDLAAAEGSFQKAISLNPRNPEAWNELGIFHLRRNRAQNAAQAFAEALRHQPDYAPAVLNLAIVSHQHLNDRASAVRRYKEYLALQPRPENWEAVNATLRELEPPAAITPVARPPSNIVAQQPPPAPVTTAAAPVTPRTSTPTTSSGASAPRTETSAVQPPRSASATPASTPTHVEVVRLAPEPTVRPAQDVASTPAPIRPTETRRVEARGQTSVPGTSNSAPVVANVEEPERRGVLQRMNPLNIFRRDSVSDIEPSRLPVESGRAERAASGQTSAVEVASRSATPGGSTTGYPRYRYHSPAAPSPGNHSAAERAFAQGAQAHRSNRLPEAVVAYRQAVEQDPAYFDAHYNLGLATASMGNLQQALMAYETALAIRPQSLDARYNFALVLKQARYPLDAAVELQRILEQFPRDARTHAVLGSLYAYDLRQPDRAREHYMKVLENDPRNPQADRIRYWLAENPR